MITKTQLVEKLKARVEVVYEIGGSIGDYPKLIEDKLGTYIKQIVADAYSAGILHTNETKKQA